MGDGHKHYVRMDVNNIIIKRFSTAFEDPFETDVCVATDAGRHYNEPVTNERGQYIAKWIDDAEVARTQSELDTEWDARPPDQPSQESRLASAEAAILSLMGL